jgi:hypothetical protein
MKPAVMLLLLALPATALCQYTYKNLRVDFLSSPASQKAYTFENLRLYPVYAQQGFRQAFKEVGSYTALPSALQQKKVRITERGNGGTVNTLVIENLSSDTVMVVCGDVVKGGQQDRIVEQDLVLAPRSGKQQLKVYCVESGRWSAPPPPARSGSRSTRSDDKRETPAEFNGHFNKGSMGLRKVVEKEKSQGKVWSKVADINMENKTSTSTQTYTALTNSTQYRQKEQRYLSHFRNLFRNDSNVIGVVVVSGNKVLGCDLFATPRLFASQFESLLHSYVSEAIVSGRPVTTTTETVKAYVDKLLTDEAGQARVLREKGNAFVNKGKKLRVSSYD